MRRVYMVVDRPGYIELHVRETVRIDRLQPTATQGYVAEPYGALLPPGVTQLPLATGAYYFRTLEDAELRIIAGGVQVTSRIGEDKDPWPDPPAMPTTGVGASAAWAAVAASGHGPCGRVPALCVIDDTAIAP